MVFGKVSLVNNYKLNGIVNEETQSNDNMKYAKCILCKIALENYTIVYHNKIRDDNDNECKIVKCIYCNHIQLIGLRPKEVTLLHIINKTKAEFNRKIKYLDIDIN